MFEEQGDCGPRLGEQSEGLVMGDVTQDGVINLDKGVTDKNIPEEENCQIFIN